VLTHICLAKLNQINASIIVAIIAISPLILNFIYTATPFITAPIMGVEFWIQSNSQILTIKNNGDAKATNMTALLISDHPISKVNVILSTVAIKSISFNDTKLKIEIPKFNHGDGSIIKLEVSIKPSSNSTFNFDQQFNRYDAYFVYDQGSNKQDKYQIFWAVLFVTIEAIAVLCIIGLVKARWMTGKIVHILLDMRYEIITDIENNTNQEINLDPHLQEYYKKLAYQNFSMLDQYTAISDLINLINKRNKAIQEKNFNQKENHLCLREIDKILKNTEWYKHGNLGMIIRNKLFHVN